MVTGSVEQNVLKIPVWFWEMAHGNISHAVLQNEHCAACLHMTKPQTSKHED